MKTPSPRAFEAAGNELIALMTSLAKHKEVLFQILNWYEMALDQDKLGRPVRLGEFPLDSIQNLADEVHEQEELT